jgi:hypothetical protein
MDIQATKVPHQYSDEAKWMKKFLHTKLGAFIGYKIGIAGFNKIDTQIGRFQRYYTPGEKLKKKEYLYTIEDGPNAGKVGVYRTGRWRHSFNSRVDKGAALTASLMTNTALGSISSPLAPIYIALTNTAITPAKSDTTLSGEIASNGLSRALGTIGGYSAPGSLDGSASYTISKTFTATGAQAAQAAAVFDAVSTGNLFVEGTFTSASLATNDTLALTWTVNV